MLSAGNGFFLHNRGIFRWTLCGGCNEKPGAMWNDRSTKQFKTEKGRGVIGMAVNDNMLYLLQVTIVTNKRVESRILLIRLIKLRDPRKQQRKKITV